MIQQNAGLFKVFRFFRTQKIKRNAPSLSHAVRRTSVIVASKKAPPLRQLILVDVDILVLAFHSEIEFELLIL